MMGNSVCWEPLDINHEKFNCYEDPHSKEEDHVWRGGAWPPCQYCAGIDEHSSTCPWPMTTNTTKETEIRWKDGEKPKIKLVRQ